MTLRENSRWGRINAFNASIGAGSLIAFEAVELAARGDVASGTFLGMFVVGSVSVVMDVCSSGEADSDEALSVEFVTPTETRLDTSLQDWEELHI